MASQIDTLLLNSSTKTQIKAFINEPSGALLISGKAGSGKKGLARHAAAILLDVDYERLGNHPHFLAITKPADKSEIPIDSVREVINKLSLRATTSRQTRLNRVFIIEDAQYLSTEAQNALLKLLEEPPARTLIILTADSEDNLLPTVVSRTQRVSVAPPSLEQSIKYFNDKPEAGVKSAYLLSQGSSELLSALLIDEDNHPLKVGVSQAKDYISNNTYRRMIQLQQLSKDKAGLTIFLDGLARVLSALHAESIRHSRANSSKILASRQAVEAAISQIDHNANTRLTMLALALNTTI
ncbi:hypothetical protein KW803_01785 [Candidatus Saccharibacteria bacterium]|nr:hypothetical protein [Candidatus Saccharibacteria bacterium]